MMKCMSIGRANITLVLGVVLHLPACAAAHADAGAPPAQSDSTCPGELKAEVLHNLWKRRPGAKPGRAAATLRVSYHNDYGRNADALLIAVDGAPVYLRCAAPEDRAEVFVGSLAAGVHHVDAVYNFGSWARRADAARAQAEGGQHPVAHGHPRPRRTRAPDGEFRIDARQLGASSRQR